MQRSRRYRVHRGIHALLKAVASARFRAQLEQIIRDALKK